MTPFFDLPNTYGDNTNKGGKDKTLSIFGVTTAADEATINLVLGGSIYSFGASAEGILYGSSVEENGHVNGQITLFTPTPLKWYRRSICSFDRRTDILGRTMVS